MLKGARGCRITIPSGIIAILYAFPLRIDVAKAQITTPLGMSVKVEGTPTEILAVVQELERKGKKVERSVNPAREKQANSGRLTLASLLRALCNEEFFKQPRDLSSIKTELDTNGH